MWCGWCTPGAGVMGSWRCAGVPWGNVLSEAATWAVNLNGVARINVWILDEWNWAWGGGMGAGLTWTGFRAGCTVLFGWTVELGMGRDSRGNVLRLGYGGRKRDNKQDIKPSVWVWGEVDFTHPHLFVFLGGFLWVMGRTTGHKLYLLICGERKFTANPYPSLAIRSQFVLIMVYEWQVKLGLVSWGIYCGLSIQRHVCTAT